MPTFLSSKKIDPAIEDLMLEAREFVCLVSPYIGLDDHAMMTLRHASRNDIKITFLCRSSDRNAKDNIKNWRAIDAIRNVNIYELSNLHAKIYLNEKTAILATKNIYERQDHVCNFEAAISFSKKMASDREMYEQLYQFVNLIFEDKGFEPFYKEAGKVKNPVRSTVVSDGIDRERIRYPKEGYCIICGRKIPYDGSKPMCPECYSKGLFNSTPGHCHRCGTTSCGTMSLNSPFCYDCYNKDLEEGCSLQTPGGNNYQRFW